MKNPVLKGFNPDPSLTRVGKTYYMATSTFEWYPGVQIFASEDLVNWRLITRPLSESRLLNLEGVPDSCGVWAPCLSHNNGKFWLAYTVVRRFDGNFKDTHMFLTTAESIDGPWSDPIFINSSGFDPSLFHARDGRKWWLNMIWDHRTDKHPFYGIVAQEFDAENATLVGDVHHIFEGSSIRLTEGPHLYEIGDYFYLVVAEGGTGYNHAVSIARSKNLLGPYEADPKGAVMTAADNPEWPLQRSGHGAIVALDDNKFVLSFLCSRRTSKMPDSPMGRESGLSNVELTDDGWIRQSGEGSLPPLEFEPPHQSPPATTDAEWSHDFNSPTLPPQFQWLRTPKVNNLCTLTERPGFLRLIGRESPGSLFEHSLIATRQTEHNFRAETCIEFEPDNFQQMAGLMLYYNSRKFHYLFISVEPGLGKYIGVMSCLASSDLKTDQYIKKRIPVESNRPIALAVDVKETHAQFMFRMDASTQFRSAGPLLDMSILTDHAGMDEGEQFTGTFVGMAAHDVTGCGKSADFDYFKVTNRL